VHTDFFNSKRIFDIAMSNKLNIFLDSGAFSAKSQGVPIDIYEYISFIESHKELLSVYANLDVIGDPIASKKNLRIMQKAGLNPLPVFHFGENPDKYLKPLIEKYDYICIGGMVKSGDLVTFLDRCFSKYICDEDGFPKIKVHGFGLTSVKMMLRYPWYSVDSTSWILTGRMGSIYIPFWKKGQWIYDENTLKIAVSNQSPTMKEAGRHISTLSVMERKHAMDYIAETGFKIGKSSFKNERQDYKLAENERWFEKVSKDKSKLRTVEIIEEPGISNSYQLRDEMNVIYFLGLEKAISAKPRRFKMEGMQDGFF
jgi:hypothetical protein